MTTGPWTYPSDFLDAMAGFGLAPTALTPPTLVRDALNDLYRYEIRRLRGRLLGGLVAKPDYLDHVVALRQKYWPLSLTLDGWERICRSCESH